MKTIVCLLLFVCLNSCSTPPPIVKTGFEGKAMPSFNLLLMGSNNQLNTNAIPIGEPIVLLYVAPNCPYCRALTQEIVENIKSLNKIRFYMLSSFPLDQITKYYKFYKLNKYPNIAMGQDYSFFFPNYFKITGVPYISIYNKHKQLKQVLVGNQSTELIKKIALE